MNPQHSTSFCGCPLAEASALALAADRGHVAAWAGWCWLVGGWVFNCFNSGAGNPEQMGVFSFPQSGVWTSQGSTQITPSCQIPSSLMSASRPDLDSAKGGPGLACLMGACADANQHAGAPPRKNGPWPWGITGFQGVRNV